MTRREAERLISAADGRCEVVAVLVGQLPCCVDSASSGPCAGLIRTCRSVICDSGCEIQAMRAMSSRERVEKSKMIKQDGKKMNTE